MYYLVLPGRLLHEEMEDSEAQRLRGSTGLLALLESCSSFSSSTSSKPLDRPEGRHNTLVVQNTYFTNPESEPRPLMSNVNASAFATGCSNLWSNFSKVMQRSKQVSVVTYCCAVWKLTCRQCNSSLQCLHCQFRGLAAELNTAVLI